MKELIPTVDTWDEVAETYSIELSEGDYEIASSIEEILVEMEILPGSSLIELGCGSGHLSACLALKGYKITLFDFSNIALDKAKQTFDKYNIQAEFIQGDLMQLDRLDKQYDIAWNSGVMEHFGDAELLEAIRNAAKVAERGMLFLVPNPRSMAYLLMRARLMSQEQWIYGTEYLRYDYDKILNLLGFDDVYSKYVNTPAVSSHHIEVAQCYYGDLGKLYEELMKESLLPEEEGYLVAYIALKNKKFNHSEGKLHHNGVTISNTKIFDLTAQKFGLEGSKKYNEKRIDLLTKEKEVLVSEFEEHIARLKVDIENSFKKEEIYSNEISYLNRELEKCVKKEETYSNEISHLNSELEKCVKREETYSNEISDLNREIENSIKREEIYSNEISNLKNEMNIHVEQLQVKDGIIKSAMNQCLQMSRSKPFQLIHFLYRIKYQWIKGDKTEKKLFHKWMFSKLHKGGGDADHRYNPIYAIINILNGFKCALSQNKILNDNKMINIKDNGFGQLSNHLKNEERRLDYSLNQGVSIEASKIKKRINDGGYKGILIYPHVVYWEPLQTPQQLLRAFAKEGWLCFFCEHSNIKDCYGEIEPGLIITHESDLLSALGDTPVTVMITWLGSLAFMNRIKNKKVWYHILDKLDIFPYYDEFYKELHNEVISKSNFVSYVAKPLLNCILDRKDAVYLPNGSNPDELLNQHENFIPNDMKAIVSKGHKIIGYYGYLAEWMDYELVADVAKARPQYEFVFIGKAIHDTKNIESLQNVHLLGLKPYKELSDYAKFFDVATIPFLINEMMNCVSPIKFYEYCSLGLPVISSHMIEIQAHTCEYVACFNTKEEYLYYLDSFAENDIKQLAKEKAPLIASKNTWISRAKHMLIQFNKEQQTILEADYNKYDLIILSVIDYDFRYQRPQHFASRFAQNGHRVFYVNANHFNESSVTSIEENLFVVNFKNTEFSAIHLTDWKNQQAELKQLLDNLLFDYGIRDAVTLVDYPNWVYGAEYLRVKYGFKIITDYMDDYTGFLNPAEKLVAANCAKLLKKSDMVIPSSQFLYDIASKYNDNINIVRNGTEFEHFYKSVQMAENKERKIIGYYGAVAQWFDFEKICYVAEHMPEYDIVIIGEVTEGKARLQKHNNIKLLGEIPYSELPKHLAYFDVCLIPFDTSTDLIKATNPVKFYEYLSAGKKIVATEIPELEPYKDKYIYLTNSNEKFVEYIQLCLNGNDKLADTVECIEFGKINDWQKRYEELYKLCRDAVPRVSIIVLTYNNLAYNKTCIKSILSKTAYPNYELIIVDNMSTDGTREYLQELADQNYKNVQVILNSSNSGFAGGNNIGISASSGDYVLLLNNDTIVTRGWITSLVKHLENDGILGMCGPVTNSIGNEAKIEVSYNSKSELNCFSYNYTWNHMGELYPNPDVLALFCTLIKREVINKCGLLDESYGIGMFEDDDYAEAVKQAGYQLAIAEDSFIHHFEGASFKKLEDEKFRVIYEENKEKFELKWGKRWITHKKRDGINWDTNIDINI